MRIVLPLFMLIFTLSGFAQSRDAVFEAHNADLLLLDSLIFEEVNIQRLAYSQAKIFKSDSLELEASKHSVAMAHQGNIFYSSSKKKAGECNIEYTVESSLTYGEISKIIVEKWLVSPGHSKLILGEYFIYGGVGVSTREDSRSDHVTIFVCFRISYWP